MPVVYRFGLVVVYLATLGSVLASERIPQLGDEHRVRLFDRTHLVGVETPVQAVLKPGRSDSRLEDDLVIAEARCATIDFVPPFATSFAGFTHVAGGATEFAPHGCALRRVGKCGVDRCEYFERDDGFYRDYTHIASLSNLTEIKLVAVATLGASRFRCTDLFQEFNLPGSGFAPKLQELDLSVLDDALDSPSLAGDGQRQGERYTSHDGRACVPG